MHRARRETRPHLGQRVVGQRRVGQRVLAGVFALVLAGACSGPNQPTTPASPSAAASTTPAASASTNVPASASPSSPAGQPPKLAVESVVGGLKDPVDIAWRADDPTSMFVVEQGGRVRIVRDAALVETPFLDIAGIVTAGGEQGLLGLAFHPKAGDRRFFVYYTALDGNQILASYETIADDRDRADPDSEVILLEMPDQFGNHNGGGLAFGPDGYLYISTGDGGGGGDPLDSGRHLDTLLAKILRIDIDAR
ncbi:MAG TPA: PQQ-dependent sugar dehydrogenase, partial [Methylomirabilota bacterium]|nr:PQQ-dependent sugar dehydrogenase [Methylomirabilota bacterium]